MYNRRMLCLLLPFTAALSVALEILTFYSLFLQFERLFLGNPPSELLYHDIMFYSALTAMSVWVHELIGEVISLGDRLELRGESVWKTNPGRKRHSQKRQNS